MNALMLAAEKKFWILDPIYTALGHILAWFYAVIPSYGVAIMLLTVTVSILRMPLVAKQVKSQAEMQRIQPELKRIQVKYKTDQQKRNEEMMRLYKEHGVNPFAGCLPLLLQMPLFIVLYRLILNLSRPEGPKHIPNGSELFRSLVESGGQMKSLGLDLAEKASAVKGFGSLLPYLVLIGLVLATGFYQQRQMTARMPKDGANQQMMMMTKILPIFMAFVSWSIPAGVVLYFFVSNLWQIGQQHFLFKHRLAAQTGGSSGPGPGPSLAKKSDGGGTDGGGSSGGRPGGKGGGGAGAGGSAGGGFFARLAKAMGTPEGPPPEGGAGGGAGGGDRAGAGRRGGSGDGGSGGSGSGSGGGRSGSGGGGERRRKPARDARGKPAASSNGRSARAAGGASDSGGKGSGGRASTDGRVTPRGTPGKGTKSRNTRRGK